jgi:UDP-N-acetyl-D-mannosaminuronic acid dehydrogenase
MKVCIIGLGYIGLPTAAMLAKNDNGVLGVDINANVLRFIRENGAPPEEPGLHELVVSVLDSGNLKLAGAPEPSDVFILCLPTPIKKDRTPDLDYVVSGMNSILGVLKKGDMVILESTVPPGTTAGLIAEMVKKKGFDPTKDLDLAFAPERVIPGNILKEIQTLDRVMGGLTVHASERARSLYSCFVKGQIYLTDATTAEFVKLIENSYRDVNIAFANELAKIAPELGINVWEAIQIANKHPRVNIHTPGPGVGGHCIAVDPYFIIDCVSPGLAKLLSAAREVNSSMPDAVVSRLKKEMGDLSGKKVAVLGIAYKGNVGDPRESPSLDIVKLLKEDGAVVMAHDPFVKASPVTLHTFEETLQDSDAIIIATNHTVFSNIKPGIAQKLVRGKLIFDTRNVIDSGVWKKAGWKVLILGDGKSGV